MDERKSTTPTILERVGNVLFVSGIVIAILCGFFAVMFSFMGIGTAEHGSPWWWGPAFFGSIGAAAFGVGWCARRILLPKRR